MEEVLGTVDIALAEFVIPVVTVPAVNPCPEIRVPKVVPPVSPAVEFVWIGIHALGELGARNGAAYDASIGGIGEVGVTVGAVLVKNMHVEAVANAVGDGEDRLDDDGEEGRQGEEFHVEDGAEL